MSHTEENNKAKLIEPYGGALVDLQVLESERQELVSVASQLPSIRLTSRQICDLELLATGAFSPLSRFMGKADYRRCVGEMRLADGNLFPIPITLSISKDARPKLDSDVALLDQRNNLLAIMSVEEIYEWDRDEFARSVVGTVDQKHPLVSDLVHWGELNISGSLRVLSLPEHFDFATHRLTSHEVRQKLELLGKPNVVAFQTRNPLHRAHEEMTKLAMNSIEGILLLHPVVGMTKPGDVDHVTRVRSYKSLIENYYSPKTAVLALLPLAMRMAGPKEALWHMLIRRNFGANYFIVGRDHASPGTDSKGKPFYGSFAAQELAIDSGDELGMKVIAFDEMVYLPDEDRYEQTKNVSIGTKTCSLSGTQVREDYLAKGVRLPEWFTRIEVADILAETYPPKNKQGFCVWFTGLSGAGKSTIAEVLTVLLAECGRTVTLLDGDIVRNNLSKGLGFTKEDRDTNILRIGYVASEIVRHGGIAVCAAVSPYRETRNDVRAMLPDGAFIEVFVNTPIEVCESRDIKGMYAKARRGEITGFTGVDDPYEIPERPEVIIDTVGQIAQDNAHAIVNFLREQRFLVF